MSQTTPPPRAVNLTLAAIAVVSSVALIGWLNKPLFRDEGATLYSIHLGWAALWRQSRVVDLVLLPYYAFLHLWAAAFGSVAWIRLPSLLAYGLTTFLVGRLATRLGGRWCGVIAALVTASNPLVIAAALDARPYMFSALTATLAAASLFRWLDSRDTRWAWAFCMASLATLLLQVFTVLGPLSMLGAAFMIRRDRFRSQGRALIAPFGSLAAGMTAFLAFVVPQRGQISWLPFKHSLRSVFSSLLGPAYEPFSPYGRLFLAVLLVGIVVCVVGWRRSRFRPSRSELHAFAICLAWALIPTVVLVAASFVQPVYLVRYVTGSAPGLAITLALILSRAYRSVTAHSSDRLRTVVGVMGVGVGLAVILPTCSLPAARHVQENLQEAAQYLETHARHDSDVATPDHPVTAVIGYYADSGHVKLSAWPQLSVQPYIDRLDLQEGLSAISKAPENVWLVVDSTYPRTSAFRARLTRHGFSAVGDTNFRGVQLLHYRRKAV